MNGPNTGSMSEILGPHEDEIQQSNKLSIDQVSGSSGGSGGNGGANAGSNGNSSNLIGFSAANSVGTHQSTSAILNSLHQKVDDYEDEDSPPAESNEPSNKKRKRVNVACVGCRDRKVRCDGAQPRCGRCTNRGYECIYIKKILRARVSVDYVRALEQKVGRIAEGEDSDWNNPSKVASKQRKLTTSDSYENQFSVSSSHPKLPSIDQHLMSVMSSQSEESQGNNQSRHSIHETGSPTNSFSPLTISHNLPSQSISPHHHHPPPNLFPQRQTTTSIQPAIQPSIPSSLSNQPPPQGGNLINLNSNQFSPPLTTSPSAYSVHSVHSTPNGNNSSSNSNFSISGSTGSTNTSIQSNLPPPPQSRSNNGPVTINSVDSTGTSYSTGSSSRPPKLSSSSSAFGDGDPNTTADAMGATITKKSTRRQDFYGSSSAMSFMKLVEAAVNAGKANNHTSTPTPHGIPRNTRGESESDGSVGNSNGGKNVTSLYGSHRYRMTRPGGPSYYGQHSGREEDWAVPPRRLADHYVQCYFTYVYSLYPFIHQPTFMSAYNSIWASASQPNSRDEQYDGNSNDNNGIGGNRQSQSDMKSYEDSDSEITEGHMFYCIMNIVFAFGCLFSSSGVDSSSRESSSQVYFDRAREHLNFDLLGAGDSGSLILLQALLLIGQYLQATQKPAACWCIVGTAVRVAQELGLYREQQISSRPSYIEQELCRRLWYGCILMDRIVSMTFGRPLMITQDFKVNPPTFIDDNYITDIGIVTPPESSPPSILAFFQQTILLYDILSDILRDFYDTHDSDTISDEELRVLILTNILETEGRLSKFRKAIPPHLQIENVSQHPQSSPFRRQTNVLRARYLHLEIMLYRPILLPHTRSYKGKLSPLFTMADSYLQSTMEKTICKLCVMAAVRLIKLVFDNKDTPNLPAIWYCIFYIYSSASVLLAAKLQPSLEGELDSESMEEGWKMGLQLLRLYERNGPSATRCLRILEVLHDKISSASHNESKPMFDFLPDLVDPTIEFGADSNLLFTMMNDNTGPFSENTIEYHYTDNPIGF